MAHKFVSSMLPLVLPFILFGLFSNDSFLHAQQETLDSFPDDLKTRAPETIEEIKLLEGHVQQLLKKVGPATVSVSGGSGVVVSEDGYVLTVAHVNQKAGRRVKITFPDGQTAWGETLGNNHSIDAGLIKITSDGKWPYVEMGESEECQRGEWCLAVGFPVSYSRGNEPALRLGRILRTSDRSVVTDCTIMGGDSGGPLFDLDGKVIGISSRVNGSLSQNIHVPVDTYRSSWDRLAKGEDWNQRRSRRRGQRQRGDRNPGYLGVQREADSTSARIALVTPGSAAEKAGILAGDTVVEVDGARISSFQELVELIGQKDVGDEVVVVVLRENERKRIPVKLGSRASDR